MLLPESEAVCFIHLYKSILVYINQRLKLISGVKTIADLERKPFEAMYRLREKLYQQPTLFEDFIQDELEGKDTDAIAIAKSIGTKSKNLSRKVQN